MANATFLRPVLAGDLPGTTAEVQRIWHPTSRCGPAPAANSRFKDALLTLGWQSVYADDRAEVLIPPQRLSASRF